MSLATAEIDCTVSPPLSGAMEDCSIVRGPQLQRLCRQNCCMSGQRRMFGSLWRAQSAGNMKTALAGRASDRVYETDDQLSPAVTDARPVCLLFKRDST